MSYRWPRLRRTSAVELLRELREYDVPALRDRMGSRHPESFFAELGAMRVPDAVIERAADEIRAIANEFGWPVQPTPSKGSEFDSTVMRVLARTMPMPISEFGAPEVWNHITCVNLLDVAAWRWGEAWTKSTDSESGDPNERFLGHKVWRNAFSRLYARALAFKETPGYIVDGIGEDARVQITERGEGARYPDWVHASAETAYLLRRTWDDVDTRPIDATGKDVTSEWIIREAVKRSRRLPPWTVIEALDHAALTSLIRTQYDAVLAPIWAGRVDWEAQSELHLTDEPAPMSEAATDDPITIVIHELSEGHLLCEDELVHRLAERGDLGIVGGEEAIRGAIAHLAAQGMIEEEGDPDDPDVIWYRHRDVAEIQTLPLAGRSLDWIATAELREIAARSEQQSFEGWLDAVCAATGAVPDDHHRARLERCWRKAGRQP